MPDIALCLSETCPSRAACFRNQASGTRPSPYRQTFADFAWDSKIGRCENFVSAERHWIHQAPAPYKADTTAADAYDGPEDPAVKPVSEEERTK